MSMCVCGNDNTEETGGENNSDRHLQYLIIINTFAFCLTQYSHEPVLMSYITGANVSVCLHNVCTSNRRRQGGYCTVRKDIMQECS